MNRAPAATASSTCSGRTTVPAPTSTSVSAAMSRIASAATAVRNVTSATGSPPSARADATGTAVSSSSSTTTGTIRPAQDIALVDHSWIRSTTRDALSVPSVATARPAGAAADTVPTRVRLIPASPRREAARASSAGRRHDRSRQRRSRSRIDHGRAPAVPVDHGAADHGPGGDPDRDGCAEPRERLGDRAGGGNPADLAVERRDDRRDRQARAEHQQRHRPDRGRERAAAPSAPRGRTSRR